MIDPDGRKNQRERENDEVQLEFLDFKRKMWDFISAGVYFSQGNQKNGDMPRDGDHTSCIDENFQELLGELENTLRIYRYL